MNEPILSVTARDVAGEVTVIAAVGEIDRDSRDHLRDAAAVALHHGRHRLVLDLTAVAFCDSSGLALLVDLHRSTAVHHGWLRLAACPPLLRTSLHATNLDRLLPMYNTVEDAAADPSPPKPS
ncbi:STAS domain-containing protein [Krasilnikovia sp. M28-CT-15]|uniref:STAS domain-containing protein n=1 Tax=Krasilnikovia sp. M28-CT-15 TaxID=3373540 RepID=UPI003876B729